MSLTTELRNASSPVRAYLDGISPVLAATRGSSSKAREMSAELGLVDLAGKPLLVPASEPVDGKLSGTAFDIRARIALGGFNPAESTSAQGVGRLDDFAPLVENGEHRARVLTEAFMIGEELLSSPSDPSDLTRASVLLAYCEQVYRGGVAALSGSLGDACDAVTGGAELADAISDAAIEDVDALLSASEGQLDEWRERIAAGSQFRPNPGFSGAKLLGGADGDWMIDDTLIDCKVYTTLSVATLRDFLRQLLGYVMLDLDDALGIREVGVWLPRQQVLKTWSLEQLLEGDPESLLPKLREGFVGATERNQIAVHVPISERRKLQLLADNQMTRLAMLIVLAQSDDKDLRFRVGRNVASPTDVVRRLARDRYSSVRKGVAMNTAAPAEVLLRLAEDSSVEVRRAVGANPALDVPSNRPQLEAGSAGILLDGSGELAVRSEAQSSEVELRNVEINQHRDPKGTPGVVLTSMLRAVLGQHVRSDFNYYLPLASRMWTRKDRSLRLPAAASKGLPGEILRDLMSDQRPAFIRREAAAVLPVEVTEFRKLLFSDKDPEIRWQALERSVHTPDPSLGEVLAELCGSREARVKFATDGLAARERWRTPTEYSTRVAELLARHPATPSDALTELISEKSASVLLILAGNTSLSPEAQELLASKMISIRNGEARALFAQDENTPVAVLEDIVADKRAELRAAVASNSTAPAHIVSQLSDDPSAEVRLAVLQNPGLPKDIAASITEELLRSSKDQVLHSLLQKLRRRDGLVASALVEEALDRLSKSTVRTSDFKCFVASDDRTSTSTLEHLAKSKDPEVRIDVIRNPRTPQSLIEALAQDKDADVRRAAVWSGRVPQDVLNALLLDDDLNVRVAAYENSETDDEVAGAEVSTEVAPATARWTPTVAELQEMAANSRAEVRIRVAYSERATPDILAFLGGERRSAKVRQAVAAHPNTPPDALRSLATRDDADTLLSLAFHPATPADLLADLAGRSAELAVIVALNPDTPREVLDALAHDTDLFVRFLAEAQREERLSVVSADEMTDQSRLRDSSVQGQLE